MFYYMVWNGAHYQPSIGHIPGGQYLLGGQLQHSLIHVSRRETKEEKIQEKVKEEKKTEKQLEREKQKEQREREKEAQRAYEKWMSKKVIAQISLLHLRWHIIIPV